MSIITLYKQYQSRKEKLENFSQLLFDKVNEFIKPLYKATISSYNDLSIRVINIDKNLISPFSGLECVEIWESNDDEFARNYTFPTYFLKLKKEQLKPELDKLIKEMEEKRKELIKKQQKKDNKKIELNEKKEYLRLKKKFEK